MSVRKRGVRLFDEEPVTAASQVIRSRETGMEDADECRLLVSVTEIGSPGAGESVTIRPVFVDDEGTEYLDDNTTYGTFALTGSNTPCNVSVVIPTPSAVMALKVTGAGSLSSSTGFKVSARYVLTSNTL